MSNETNIVIKGDADDRIEILFGQFIHIVCTTLTIHIKIRGWSMIVQRQSWEIKNYNLTS